MLEHENRIGDCAIPRQPDYAGVEIVTISPNPAPADYQVALELAKAAAEALHGGSMLLSWYDRDRDFESPPHTSECDHPGAVPGYVDYGLSHGATLKVDIGQGRFVFFFLPLAGLR